MAEPRQATGRAGWTGWARPQGDGTRQKQQTYGKTRPGPATGSQNLEDGAGGVALSLDVLSFPSCMLGAAATHASMRVVEFLGRWLSVLGEQACAGGERWSQRAASIASMA